MIWQLPGAVEVSFLEKLLDKGGPMLVCVVISLYGLWKLGNRTLDKFEEMQKLGDARSERQQSACDERAKERNQVFLDHNKEIAQNSTQAIDRLTAQIDKLTNGDKK